MELKTVAVVVLFAFVVLEYLAILYLGKKQKREFETLYRDYQEKLAQSQKDAEKIATEASELAGELVTFSLVLHNFYREEEEGIDKGGFRLELESCWEEMSEKAKAELSEIAEALGLVKTQEMVDGS